MRCSSVCAPFGGKIAKFVRLHALAMQALRTQPASHACSLCPGHPLP
jgi:hypothetical protein